MTAAQDRPEDASGKYGKGAYAFWNESPAASPLRLQARIAELETALRDILEGVGAFTPDGWLANTEEIARARSVLEDA